LYGQGLDEVLIIAIPDVFFCLKTDTSSHEYVTHISAKCALCGSVLSQQQLTYWVDLLVLCHRAIAHTGLALILFGQCC